MGRRKRSCSRKECAKSNVLTSSACNPRRSPGSQGSTPTEALLVGGGNGHPPGGGNPPLCPAPWGFGPRTPTTIEMLLAFLIVGLRDTLANGTVSLTLTAAKYSVNLQLPCVLLLMIMFAMIWQDHRRR